MRQMGWEELRELAAASWWVVAAWQVAGSAFWGAARWPPGELPRKAGRSRPLALRLAPRSWQDRGSCKQAAPQQQEQREQLARQPG